MAALAHFVLAVAVFCGGYLILCVAVFAGARRWGWTAFCALGAGLNLTTVTLLLK